MKKLVTNVLATLMLSGTMLSIASCGPNVVDKIDTNKTQLYIGNYNSGIGYKWLDEAKERFETANAEVSFEEGKKGVQIFVDHSKNYSGQAMTTTVPSSPNEIFFASIPYFGMAGTSLRDITDLVTKTVNKQDGKTIESKLYDTDKEALKVNGKYYGIPSSVVTYGLTYDAGIFERKNLYFSDVLDESDTTYVGTKAFVKSKTDKKSCGPDGKYTTYDDGLPSSMAEMSKLVDRMVRENVIPFLFNGSSTHYTNMLMMGLFSNLLGGNAMQASFTFDSKGEEIEIVTGFDGDNPNYGTVAITKENANKIRSSRAYYEAAKFCKKIFGDKKYYHTDGESPNFSHIDAQEKFLKSGLDGEKYIGMLIEGDYWYNEADMDGILEDVKSTYPTTYQQKDVRYMALPSQIEGTVEEGEGKAPVLVNTQYYAFINATIPKNHVKVAEEFISFVYGDEELRKATIASNGLARGVKYDMSDLTSQNSFIASVYKLRGAAETAGNYIASISSDSIFKRNQLKLGWSTSTHYMNSTVKGRPYSDVFNAFKDGATAKDYFLGLAISDQEWNTNYNV